MPARPDLSRLKRALAECRDAGTLPRLWLRDDDAIAPTPALDRLCALADVFEIPVHLAVIPAHATDLLGAFVADHPQIIPVVHGFAHQSHAPVSEKKAEFGPHRPVEMRLAEVHEGLGILRGLFGERLYPAFVPPWNRMAADMLDGLAASGYRMVSTYGPRDKARAAAGLRQINTHIDPIDWRGTRGLANPDLILSRLCLTLEDRARGNTDATEPLGLLTHHLVHDDAIWDFCQWLAGVLFEGGATPWRADHEEPEI